MHTCFFAPDDSSPQHGFEIRRNKPGSIVYAKIQLTCSDDIVARMILLIPFKSALAADIIIAIMSIPQCS